MRRIDKCIVKSFALLAGHSCVSPVTRVVVTGNSQAFTVCEFLFLHVCMYMVLYIEQCACNECMEHAARRLAGVNARA